MNRVLPEANVNSLYDTDFVEWSEQAAQRLRTGRIDEVDLALVAEEIEDLGKNHRLAVSSQMLHLLIHQIKRKIQPERETPSWRRSIVNAQEHIRGRLEAAPSLKPHLEDQLPQIYRRAIAGARFETGVQSRPLPDDCPFSVTQLLENFDLDWPESASA